MERSRRLLIKGSAAMLLSSSAFLTEPSLVKALQSPPLKIFHPDNNYPETPAFKKELIYSREQWENNKIVGLGDSTMWGSSKRRQIGIPDPNSYINYFKKIVESDGNASVGTFNWANPGWTIDLVQEQISSEGTQRWIKDKKTLDIWLSVGWNEFITIIDRFQKAEKIRMFVENPTNLDALGATYHTLKQLPDIFERFTQKYQNLLLDIVFKYSDIIQNLVVFSSPDFGKIKNLDTGLLEDNQTIRIGIKSSRLNNTLRFILHNSSVYLNDQIGKTIDNVNRVYPNRVNLVGVDIINLPGDPFEDDVHLNEQAKIQTAQICYERVSIKPSAAGIYYL